MIRIATLSICAATLAGSVALAQTPVDTAPPALRSMPPEPFKFLSNQDIATVLMQPEAGQTLTSDVVNDHENYYTEFVKRVDHGNKVEVHALWYDFITVLSGAGSVVYGGTVNGATQRDQYEVRGDSITGGTTKALHPGDYIEIPAGMPHKFDAAPGQQLTYVIFKVRQ